MIFINFEATEPPWFSFGGEGKGGDTGLQLSLPSLGQPVPPPQYLPSTFKSVRINVILDQIVLSTEHSNLCQ